MHYPESAAPLIALTGPSGVGKGFVSQLIRENLAIDFGTPVVCTTRPPRADDGPNRRAGMSPADFARQTIDGQIVLPHQPFRLPKSPWYGFAADSLPTNQPILTEAHTVVLGAFRELVSGRPALFVGMSADDETRRANLLNRQPDISETDLLLRLYTGETEMDEIATAEQAGYIDIVVDVSKSRRNETVKALIPMIRSGLYGSM